MTVTYEMKATKQKNIFSYKSKDGEIKFMFRLHLGKDEVTNKPKNTTGRGFDTISEALAARDTKKSKFEARKRSSKNQPILFKDLAYQWLEEYKEGNIEPSTFYKTAGIVKNHIIPVMGDVEFVDITAKDCKLYIKEFSKRVKNFKKITSYASLILQHGVLEEYIALNPFHKLTDSDKEGTKRPSTFKSSNTLEKRSYLFPEELNSLLDFLENETDSKIYTFFRFLAYTGCRRGEVFALTWRDIDFTDKKVTINKAVGYSSSLGNYLKGTKNGLIRCIALDDKTLSVLKDWQTKQKEILKFLNLPHKNSNQLIFQNMSNNFINGNKSNQWLEKAKNSLSFCENVQLSSHSFRHSHATICASNGTALVDIQHRLGHVGSDTTTKFYIHPTATSDKKMSETFVKALEDARKSIVE